MYAVGEGIVRSAGLPFDVLKPLLAETAAKALDAAPRLENIYSIISNNIWEISKKI